MTNIIPFRNDAASSSAKDAWVRAKRLRAARLTKRYLQGEDQLRVPQNLHLLLEELSAARRLKKITVAHEAGLKGSSPTDSTKRLLDYTCKENPSDSKRRSLKKKVRRYFEIADAIGKLLDEPADRYLARIFEGCSYGTDVEITAATWEEDRWGKLHRLIDRMTAALTRDARLDQYWREVQLLSGHFDPQSLTISLSGHAWDQYGLSVGLADNAIHLEEMPPVPSVPLGRRQLAEPHAGSLQLEGGVQIDVHFRHWLQVRYAIAPLQEDGRLGPLLEFRTVMDAVSEEHGVIGFDNPFTAANAYYMRSKEPIRAAQLGGVWRDVAGTSETGWPDPEYRVSSEHSYCGWHEIHPALLQKVFGEDGRRYEPEALGDRHPFEEDGPTRFQWGLPASYFHHALINGSVENAMRGVCRAHAESLARYQDELEKAVSTAEEDAISRWSAPGNSTDSSV